MRIALIAAEAHPFSKTGGLADVAGALFREYTGMGHESFLFVPLYRCTRQGFEGAIEDTGVEIQVPLASEMRRCRLFTLKSAVEGPHGQHPSADRSGKVYFIAEDGFFDRDELYGTAAGEYSDNDRRFAFFSRAALEACRHLGLNLDVIHCNDWHTGLIPLYLKSLYRAEPAFGRTRSLFTIHNLAYQGIFGAPSLAVTGLGREFFSPEGIEFFGKVNFLKAGIVGADVITTVSRTYAGEILTKDFGFGLDGLLRKRAERLHGVLNGLDLCEWDPREDRCLPAAYSADDLRGKKVCKKELIRKSDLKATVSSPLISFVGRLAHQKGIELIAEAIPELVQGGARFVIIGKGDETLQALVRSLGERYPGTLYAVVGFDEPLARLAYAGSDIFLMPSLYEPCGLGQMIAMRYGTAPVGRRTGGLADTILDCGTEPEKLFCSRFAGDVDVTGFLFDDYSVSSFSREVKRALCCYDHQDIWRKVIRNGMIRDFSWARAARQYEALYLDLMKT